MAVTDNIQTRIFPQVGDADITDIINAGALSGTGNRTLVDVAGEKAWNITAADLDLATPAHLLNKDVTDTGITIAVRYRLNLFGSTAGFNAMFSAGSINSILVTKNGGDTRVKAGTATLAQNLGGNTEGEIHTFVFRYATQVSALSGAETIDTWVNEVGRVGTAPNFAGAGTTGVSDNVSFISVRAPDTMDYDLLDFVYWDRELTDAEAASVADDLRGVLPVSGGSTVVNATPGVSTTSAFAATITGSEGTVQITTEPLKNNTGTLLASTGSITADVYSIATGALVVRKTGLTSSAAGVVSFTDALLVTATEYRVIISISTSDGVARITAS